MTKWKSALFRVNHSILSNGLFIPLNFRPVGIRFFHNPLPYEYCSSLSITLPPLRNSEGLPSSAILRFKWLSILLLLRWIYGLLHGWIAIQPVLSILNLLSRSTLIDGNEDYKGSTFAYTFHFSLNPVLLLRKAIALGT